MSSSSIYRTIVRRRADDGGHERSRGRKISFAIACGGTVELDESRERIDLRSASDEIVLTIRMSSDGPVLSFSSARIEVAQARVLRLSADHIEVHARTQLDISSAGSASQTIAGDLTTHCDGRVQVEAGSASMIAHSGDLQLDSSRDLRIDGDRVLVNC